MKVHPLLAKRPGPRFELRVVRSRPLTPTTHGIEVQKPEGFTFEPTQFTFLQLDTPDGVDVRPMSLATSPTRPNILSRITSIRSLATSARQVSTSPISIACRSSPAAPLHTLA